MGLWRGGGTRVGGVWTPRHSEGGSGLLLLPPFPLPPSYFNHLFFQIHSPPPPPPSITIVIAIINPSPLPPRHSPALRRKTERDELSTARSETPPAHLPHSKAISLSLSLIPLWLFVDRYALCRRAAAAAACAELCVPSRVSGGGFPDSDRRRDGRHRPSRASACACCVAASCLVFARREHGRGRSPVIARSDRSRRVERGSLIHFSDTFTRTGSSFFDPTRSIVCSTDSLLHRRMFANQTASPHAISRFSRRSPPSLHFWKTVRCSHTSFRFLRPYEHI
ncbi:hypothetical protein EUGRSUZ_A00905 [Eucalyptus grandis]|uniref:Uncharacterized protein n=2 Tax=Eucalyptus grandis TaxID=71139 RepID=A0ACC3M0I4_EUCGR|nr:hypothetical protein EUGRSUZ_A00905 [Eucalyptus grandis]